MKQQLSQTLQHRLSPQQIQLMKLLQVPTMLLEKRIKEELEENPALEEVPQEVEKDYDINRLEEDTMPERALNDYYDNYMEGDSQLSYNMSSNANGMDFPAALERSFDEHLENQVQFLKLEEEGDKMIALQIIGSIDQDGYLRRDLTAIADDLLFSQNMFVEVAQVEAILKKIQQFEPSGVGARDLRECLLIQINQKLESDKLSHFEHIEPLSLAQEVLEFHFDTFAKKHYVKLQELLNVDEEQLKAAISEITRLNPKPASGFASNNNTRQYIVPDFILTQRDGVLHLNLHDKNTPSIKVSGYYENLLVKHKKNYSKEEREAANFIKERIESAKWFIDAIQQRRQTLYKTMYAIMEYQEAYFKTGDEKKLRPMILKDIASKTNLDISTISRVVNSKFVETEFGIKHLKDFFSDSFQTDNGKEVSTIEIKQILKEVIEKENKKRPLSDEKLTEILNQKGYPIARRTISKYREQLDFPVARMRKQL